MKKALLFSTAAAVVALPTLAGAQVSVSGPSGNVQVDYSMNESVMTDNGSILIDVDGDGVLETTQVTAGTYSDDITVSSVNAESTSMDLDWSMSGKNCCFSYGGFIGTKANDGGNVTLDDANIYVDMGTAGRVELGIDGSASKGVFDRDYLSKGPLNGGTDILNPNANLSDTFDASNTVGDTSIEYTNTIAGFSVALEHDLEESNWEAGIGYSLALGGSTVDIAAATTSADAIGVTAAATFGDYSVKAGYAEDGDDETSTYIGAATTFSGIGLSLEYVMNDASSAQGSSQGDLLATAESSELIAGASYSLAPGLTASAALAFGSYEGTDDVNSQFVINGVAMGPRTGSGDVTRAAVRLKLGF